MRILLLTFYFRPDLSACAFRSTALVTALQDLAPPSSTIDVITTAPNRYHSFVADAPPSEHNGGVTVTRIALPAHRSGVADQSRAFAAFSRGATRHTRGHRYDIVVATSSRLMTAVLGAQIARRTGAKLYLDIRDIFVDTIADIFPGPMSRAAAPLLARLERWAVSRATAVNLVSRGFAPYFDARYPGRTFSYFTNGIDDEFTRPTLRSVRDGSPSRPLTILYAGNIGEGQGLHAIIPGLARALGPRVQFRIIGDGGRRGALEAALRASGVANVACTGPVARPALLEAYAGADVLFLHLNDHEAFKKVLPSKVFEYAAVGKPVLAGVAGYAAEFIEGEISNAAVFAPCDVNGAVSALARLRIEDCARTEFVRKYDRGRISRAIAADILAVADRR